MPPKLPLANLPTPLMHFPELDKLVGAEVWVKRDDMSGGAETGNKIRKLEYLLAAARQQGATAVLTCGGAQSNHARATAVLARRLGMSCTLVLRQTAENPSAATGNLFLSQLAGAYIEVVSEQVYATERNAVMAELATKLTGSGECPYIIPEGGSNGLGTLGYVDAVGELATQLTQQSGAPQHFAALVTACGSGGTAAGLQLGLRRHPIAAAVWAMAVCDDQAFFDKRIAELVQAGSEHRPDLSELTGPACQVWDDCRGPAYGVASPEQHSFIVEVARATGLVLDPSYTGKALYGLAQHAQQASGPVCFIHTGGLPGLLAQPDVLDAALQA